MATTDPSLQGGYRRTEAPYFSTHFVPPGRVDDLPARLVRHRLLLDNRDRTDAANTSPFDFRIDFKTVGLSRIENVVSAELTALSFPKISGETYVIIDSFELNDHIDSSAVPAQRAYNVALFEGDNLLPGNVKTLRHSDMAFGGVKAFNPPLSQLDRISLQFKKYNGNVVTLSDTNNVGTVSLCLEIVTDPSLLRR